MGTKTSPRTTIVNSSAFCKVDSSSELSKIDFSHSLDPKRTFIRMRLK